MVSQSQIRNTQHRFVKNSKADDSILLYGKPKVNNDFISMYGKLKVVVRLNHYLLSLR